MPRQIIDAKQPVGLKGNRLQIRLSGSYFTAFLVNRTTIDLQNRQNLSSLSRIFASILQVRQAASVVLVFHFNRDFPLENSTGFPLWKRGIEGDFISMRRSNPPYPPFFKGGNARCNQIYA